MRPARGAIRIDGTPVGSDRRPWLLHDQLHVRFGVMEEDRRDAAVLFDQHVEQHIGGMAAARRNQLAHAFALKPLVPLVPEGHEDHAAPAIARREVVVVPVRQPVHHFLTHPLPRCRILEPLQHLLAPAVVRPRRHDRRQIVLPRRVRVHVRTDVVALVARLLDHRDDLVRSSPQLFMRDLHVDDIDRDLRALADLNRLVDGAEHAFAFVADMGRIDAAVLLGHRRQLDQVCRGRDARGRLQERGREAHRALLHRLRDQPLHRRELLRGRRRLAVPFDVGPDLLFANVRRDVRRHVLPLELLEIPTQRRPVDGHAVRPRARLV